MLHPADENVEARSYRSPGRSSATISTRVAESEASPSKATVGFTSARLDGAGGLARPRRSRSDIFLAQDCPTHHRLQPLRFCRIQLQRAHRIAESERIQHIAMAVGERFRLQDVHPEGRKNTGYRSEEVRPIGRDDRQRVDTVVAFETRCDASGSGFREPASCANGSGLPCVFANSASGSLPETLPSRLPFGCEFAPYRAPASVRDGRPDRCATTAPAATVSSRRG